jgi:hypothetical protein
MEKTKNCVKVAQTNDASKARHQFFQQGGRGILALCMNKSKKGHNRYNINMIENCLGWPHLGWKFY